MMREEQTPEMKKLIRKMKRNFSFIEAWFFGGDFDKELKYIEREEELIKHFQGDLPEEIKELHVGWLHQKSQIYSTRGDLAHGFKYANETLKFAQLYDNKRGISLGIHDLGWYYWLSGDLDKALVHIDRAISLNRKGEPTSSINSLNKSSAIARSRNRILDFRRQALASR